MSQVLYAVMCSAPPVTEVRDLIAAAQERDYDICVICTPTAATWLAADMAELADLTGHPVRSTYKAPADPDVLPPPDAVLVAPLTFNTLNKWAAGISDTLALGIVNEAIGKSLPIVACPTMNHPLTAHPATPASINTLRSAGVIVVETPPAETPTSLSWPALLDELSLH